MVDWLHDWLSGQKFWSYGQSQGQSRGRTSLTREVICKLTAVRLSSYVISGLQEPLKSGSSSSAENLQTTAEENDRSRNKAWPKFLAHSQWQCQARGLQGQGEGYIRPRPNLPEYPCSRRNTVLPTCLRCSFCKPCKLFIYNMTKPNH